MKGKKLYRLEVAPLAILPLTRPPFFSYLALEPIKKGSCVAISFGKRSLRGIVFDCSPFSGQAPIWMKVVSGVITDQFLTAEQLELARYVSDEYFTSLGKTLKHFLPKPVKTRSIEEAAPVTLETLRPNKAESSTIHAFSSQKGNVTGYIDTSALQDPKRLFVELAKKVTRKDDQALFLVPEIALLPGLKDTFSKHYSRDKIAILHSKLALGPYFEAWEKIRSGKAAVILATRQGLFAPFQRLRLVTLLDEQDESYKQWDMSPRYDGKRTAEKLAALHDAKFLLVSETPSIESRYRIKQKTCTPLSRLTTISPLQKSLEVVNLRLERFKRNFSPLSQSLVDALRDVLSTGYQAILYVHRQGMSVFSVCENCKTIFRCLKSGHILISAKDGTYFCSFCGYKTGSFPSCPNCGHLSFRSVGYGTERVEQEVRKLFPKASIFRADKTTMKGVKSGEEFFKKASAGKVDILIGTQVVLKADVLPKLALIGMIDADSLLFFPDFRADERFFHILSRFAGRLALSPVKKKFGRVVVQTFHPESTFFQRIASLDVGAFTEKILTEREHLHYPPYSRFISIVCQETTEKGAETAAEKLAIALQELFPRKDRRFRASISQSAQKKVFRKLFERSVIVRIPAGEPLSQAVRSFLSQASARCVIDVDPLSII